MRKLLEKKKGAIFGKNNRFIYIIYKIFVVSLEMTSLLKIILFR